MKRCVTRYFDEHGKVYLEADSVFNGRTRRNPILKAEDSFDALHTIHHTERAHVGKCEIGI